jgi:serine/threonine protein kinase
MVSEAEGDDHHPPSDDINSWWWLLLVPCYCFICLPYEMVAGLVRCCMKKRKNEGDISIEILEEGGVPATESPEAEHANATELLPPTYPTMDYWASASSGSTATPRAVSQATSFGSHAGTGTMPPTLPIFEETDFEFERCIGQGSFGRVFEGTWRQTPVALKVLAGAQGMLDLSPHDTVALGVDLQREASLMAQLRHPSIVSLLGVCLAPPCMVTEYCMRGSLASLLREAKSSPDKAMQLTWQRRLGMLIDAARGMLYLHSNKPPVLHRDLKSPNILVSEHWQGKVGDFGLSRMRDEFTGRSTTGGLATNPRWLSPEVIEGKSFSAPSDVFSFGVVMWEVLTCEMPWIGIHEWGIVNLVMQGRRLQVPQLSDLPVPCPSQALFSDYVGLMERCWAHQPEDRPNFDDVVRELQEMQSKA